MEGAVSGTRLAGRYKRGECFLDEFSRQTSPWKDRIEVYAGDLLQIGWAGAPIEFLFVDAMKSWDLANFIVRESFSALIPGVAYVVHQDFAYHHTSWIHLIMYRLREYVDSVEHVPNSSSHVFRCCRRIPAALLNDPLSFSSFRPDEIDRAFGYSLELVPPEVRGGVAAAKVMWFIQESNLSRACGEFVTFLAAGLPAHGELGAVRQYLRRTGAVQSPSRVTSQ